MFRRGFPLVLGFDTHINGSKDPWGEAFGYREIGRIFGSVNRGNEIGIISRFDWPTIEVIFRGIDAPKSPKYFDHGGFESRNIELHFRS